MRVEGACGSFKQGRVQTGKHRFAMLCWSLKSQDMRNP